MGIWGKLFGSKAAATSVQRLNGSYSNREYNLTLSYPEHWEILSENQTDLSGPFGLPVQLAGPKVAASRPGISVVTTVVQDSGGGLAGYMRKVQEDLSGQFSGFRLVRKKETSWLGWPTAWMTYSYSGDTGPIQELNVTAFLGQGRVSGISWFQFICESGQTEFDNQLPQFEAIMNSVRFGVAGLRHPQVVLTGASQCGRCERSFGSDDEINAMRDGTTGRLEAVCETCRRG